MIKTMQHRPATISNTNTRRKTQAYIMLPLMLLALANCKKKDKDDNNNTNTHYVTTEHLKQVYKYEGRFDGTMKAAEVKEMSATADGRLHLLYLESNSFGAANYFRRTLSAGGDSLGAPTIHTDVLDIAANNPVTDNWAFAPHTDKLGLSYHPAGSYVYKVYQVDDMSKTYQFTDASFGNLPWLCTNGDKLCAYGYNQYFSNSTYYQSQYYFTWNHNGIDYKGGDLHVIPATTAAEDQQRRAFAAEPLDDNTLGLCYTDGTHIYIKGYDRVSGTTQMLDSLPTNVLQHLTRVSVADASMKIRTSRDGQKLIFCIKSEPTGTATPAMNKYATFTYTKATRKLASVVGSVDVVTTSAVNFDNDGNLLYAQADDMTAQYAWSIYKVSAAGTPVKVAHVTGQTPAFTTVTSVREFNGKIYVATSMPSVPSATLGPISYLFAVE